MANRLLKDDEVKNIIKKYSALDKKRRELYALSHSQYKTDCQLTSEINGLISSTKIIDNSKFNSNREKKMCMMIYAHVREIKYKIRFHELGLYDEQGYAQLEDENGRKLPSLNQKNDIKKLIKDVYDVYKYNEKIVNLPYKIDDEIENGIFIQFRRVTQDLADLYYFCDDIEQSILYYEEAVNRFNSIKSATQLVGIYTKIENYINIDLAEKYFKLAQSFPLDDENNVNIHLAMKMMAFSYLYHYYFNNGDYDNALLIAKENALRCDEWGFPNEYKKITKEFVDACIKKKEANDNSIIEYKGLEKYFSVECIDLMSIEMKTFIQTSISLYEVLNSSSITMDYSAVNIPILKGIESLLYKIFGVEYLSYLSTIKKIDFNELDRSFYNYNKIENKNELKQKIDNVEYGSAIHAACFIRRNRNNDLITYIPRDYFMSFCREKCLIDDEYNVVVEFVKNLDIIREIRNKAAHRFRVQREDADICRKHLFVEIRFIEFIYKQFNNVIKQ